MRELRTLILGATGMLGHTMFRDFSDAGCDVVGTVRSPAAARLLPDALRPRVLADIDVENIDTLVSVFADVRPAVVINCIGLVKQLENAEDPLAALPLNAMLPHRLARLCRLANARLIQISTDCVFSGRKGNYTEADESDARDVYGRSKFLGEVHDVHTITLRTSIIGHELSGAHGLLEWFLSQTGTVRGYRRAIFSGVPTIELARVVRERVLPRPELSGVYHVASAPIAKFDLLRLFADAYAKTNSIVPDDGVAIDRSLNASRFRAATGYVAPSWPDLVRLMRDFH